MTVANSTLTPLPIWLVLGASVLLVNGIGVGILVLSGQSATWGYVALAIALIVFPTILLLRDRLLGEYLAVVIFLVLVGAAAILSSDFYQLRQGEVVSDIPVEQASDYPQASQFQFTDGGVRPNLAGQHIQRIVSSSGGPTQRNYYFVAPIVAADWQSGEPVPAWAGCSSSASAVNPCQADWQQPYQAGLVVPPRERQQYRQAIADATRTHNLATADAAPVLQWVANPGAALRDRGRNAILLWLGMNIIFIVAFIMIRLRFPWSINPR